VLSVALVQVKLSWNPGEQLRVHVEHTSTGIAAVRKDPRAHGAHVLSLVLLHVLLQTRPAGHVNEHAAHNPAPANALKKPVGHVSHTGAVKVVQAGVLDSCCPAAHVAGHATQGAVPGKLLNLPAEQETHELSSSLFAHVLSSSWPAEHAIEQLKHMLPVPRGLKVPVGHAAHIVLDAGVHGCTVYWPAVHVAQLLHGVRLAAELKFTPVTHGVQTLSPIPMAQ
jgi:hypothetical protein